MPNHKPAIREGDRIDVEYDYNLCVWARHFNVSEKQVKEAVAAVGDRAVKVQDHLRKNGRPGRDGASGRERPSSY